MPTEEQVIEATDRLNVANALVEAIGPDDDQTMVLFVLASVSTSANQS